MVEHVVNILPSSQKLKCLIALSSFGFFLADNQPLFI